VGCVLSSKNPVLNFCRIWHVVEFQLKCLDPTRAIVFTDHGMMRRCDIYFTLNAVIFFWLLSFIVYEGPHYLCTVYDLHRVHSVRLFLTFHIKWRMTVTESSSDSLLFGPGLWILLLEIVEVEGDLNDHDDHDPSGSTPDTSRSVRNKWHLQMSSYNASPPSQYSRQCEIPRRLWTRTQWRRWQQQGR